MWTFWQDTQGYGATGLWYGRKSVDGHIVKTIGGYANKQEAEQAAD